MLYYEISECGEIHSLLSNRVLKQELTKAGYFRVNIKGPDGKFSRQLVHRLVAAKFIPNPENKPQVNHKDGNKLNNCVCNLEWVTAKQNMQHAADTGLNKGYRVLSDEVVLDIVRSKLNNKELSQKYGVSSTAIYNIRTGRAYSKLTGLSLAKSRGKLQPSQVIEIYNSTSKAEDLAKAYGKTVRLIYQIKDGTAWGHVTKAHLKPRPNEQSQQR